MVTKTQEGEWHPCSNYTALNAMTVPNRYPIPHVMDFYMKLAGQKVFSKINLIHDSHQIPLAEEGIQKMTIKKPFGL